MGTYARIKNNVVIAVIEADDDVIVGRVLPLGEHWVETDPQTHGGVHASGGTPLRKNYAGIGMTYDADRDAFIPEKPYASWSLNETTCLWEPPTNPPDDGQPYIWDEDSGTWQVADLG